MRKKQDTNKINEDKDDKEESYSKNKIPKKVRNLLRTKKKASDSLRTVQSVNKCLALRKKIENSEEELKSLYLVRKHKMEEAAIAKIKKS